MTPEERAVIERALAGPESRTLSQTGIGPRIEPLA